MDDLVQRMSADKRLGVAQKAESQTVVVDYSSPNLAKEMHIGHLRSSVIGDALCRVLEFSGDKVVRQNHLGDWGTQFGMLLEHLLESGWDQSADHSIGDLNALYQDAKKRFDADSEFAERSRQRVVSLQAGEEHSIKLWQLLIGESVKHMNSVYGTLGLLLEDSDIRPESFYNDALTSVVEELRTAGILVESEGAQCVFAEGFKNRDGDPLPLIVQKKDGGFGYAATDLAAVRFRVSEYQADRIIYVVDKRQADHFGQVFWTLKKAEWVTSENSLEHVAFGTILGKDLKPFKTREGDTVRLEGVLDEATARATTVVAEKSQQLSKDEQAQIGRTVGIGAVKYADLSSERIKDYVFDWDRMLALDGNTSPYLQNAYVRIQSILRKADVKVADLTTNGIQVVDEAERELALELLRFPSVVENVARSLEPHRLCNYLFDLASKYHSFYEKCPVIKAASAETKESRLALSALVGETLRKGLELLGIGVTERM